ncbi:MAG: hypothetical protein NT037_16055 [Hyphomicrobiales bacterium]|nr:hypothetical protein [Hyphomicrobiales bacterium]
MNQQTKRGRPQKAFLSDPDRYAVALLHAHMTRVKKNGKWPSRWMASRLAALVEYEVISDDPLTHSPPAGRSPSGRKLPTPKRLSKGPIREITLQPIEGMREYDSIARRLQDKYTRWSRRGSLEAGWLDWMADAWTISLYPKQARGQGLPPEKICVAAAARAGELEFALTVLLPRLRSALVPYDLRLSR